jgi:DNA primase large subunit
MSQSRKTQVSLIDIPYYHCVSRYVRRFFCVAKINLRDRVTNIAEVERTINMTSMLINKRHPNLTSSPFVPRISHFILKL